MQVLKFGGSSVANAQNMAKVIDIVTNAVDRDRTILVSSAISGCTDTLIKIGTLASERDESYKTLIDQLQARHHDIIDSFLPVEKQVESKEVCDGLFDSLRSIAQGVYLLGELSPASLDAIQSFGELWSTKILATKLASTGGFLMSGNTTFLICAEDDRIDFIKTSASSPFIINKNFTAFD